MTIKHFCDECGAEASPAETISNFVKMKNIKFGKGKNCYLTICVSFGFRDHPAEFGGPPDLCGPCQATLIKSILAIKNWK